MLYQLFNVSKIYKINNKENFFALKNINISLPNKGFISFIGPSGCGKSTLLNLLTTIDKPSNGRLLYKNKQIKNLSYYRNEEIGIVFQHYNLQENETVKDNILEPKNIAKEELKETYLLELLEKVNLPKTILDKRVCDLSGGEKQRVVILRSLINNPIALFADEPTGALDDKNSSDVFNILKDLSKDILVVVVSHNLKRVKSLSDMTIYLENGQIKKIEENNKIQLGELPIKNKVKKRSNNWHFKKAIKNIKNRLGKLVISLCSIILGVIASNAVLGFSFSYKEAISLQAKKQLDYGVMTIQKEKSVSLGTSGMTLTRKTRLSKEELRSLSLENKEYILNNYSYFFPNNISINYSNHKLDSISFLPIYSFKSCDESILLSGRFPSIDSLNEVVVNKEFKDRFESTFNVDILNNNIDINISKEINLPGSYGDDLYEYFIFEENLKIVGVVDDFNFLTTSKIYYSYVGYEEYLTNEILENLYYQTGQIFSWKELVDNADNNSELASYSHYYFVDPELVESFTDFNYEDITISSPSLIREESFIDLLSAASIGLNIFLIICLIGVSLIIGIISFSSFAEDKRKIAILYCLGASKNDISSIYSNENLLVTILGLLIAILLSPLSIFILNKVLEKFTGIPSLIKSLFFSLKPTFLIISMAIILAMILITIFSALIPINFGSGFSLGEELKND